MFVNVVNVVIIVTIKDCMKTTKNGDQLITGDLQGSSLSRMYPLMQFLIIVKPKKIHSLVKIT